MKDIKIGYEVGTSNEVSISYSHLIVTGVTQLSGKTTTLEALIKRSGLKAIVFKTKIGEKSFTQGTEIPPFFRDRSDYEFVKSLIEAYAKEKLFLEKGTLMQLCKGSVSLIEIKKKVDEALLGKLRGLQTEIYTRLQHYLENLIPQIQYANLSKVLTIYEGINIMNLERFSEEAQSLIIQSVAEEVLKTMREVVIVIPEAWKFIPQKYNNPCKRAVESYIRQGAANNNYIWIDSQDMAGVDKSPLKQISTWILGFQSEINEVKHTIDQIPLNTKSKPKPEEIMTLKIGHFVLVNNGSVKKVYVQPAWLEDNKAFLIAKGEIDIKSITKPESLVPFSIGTPQQDNKSVEIRFDDSKIRKELVELRQDFFNKIQELQNGINKAYQEIYNLKTQKTEVDIDEIVSKVLQKGSFNNSVSINEEAIINKVLAKVPKQVGGVVYEVAPLEKIKKDFLQETKEIIISDVNSLDEESKKIMKYVESLQRRTNLSEVMEKGLFLNPSSGSRSRVQKKIQDLFSNEVFRKDGNWVYPNLMEKIRKYLEQHGATQSDIELVYNHVLMEVSGNSSQS